MFNEPDPSPVQCANPACRKAIPTPQDGQALELEVVSISVPASDEGLNTWDESPKREARRVYLCSQCAHAFSIKIGADGITVVAASAGE